MPIAHDEADRYIEPTAETKPAAEIKPVFDAHARAAQAARAIQATETATAVSELAQFQAAGGQLN